MSGNNLKVGSIAMATVSASCPKCGGPVEIKVRISIENLSIMSMIVWPHQDLFNCTRCFSRLVPLITEIETGAIKWGLSPVLSPDKSIIEKPGQFDITKLM